MRLGNELVQVMYWLALSVWLGGALFIFVAANVIFRTVKENDPRLPRVLSVNLEGEHSTLLSGSIMGNLLGMLGRIGIVCAGVLLVTQIGQWFSMNTASTRLVAFAIVRSALYLCATVIQFYDWRVLWPKIWQNRQKFIDNADSPEIADPILEELDRYQRDSMLVLKILVFLLIGMVLFSVAMSPQPVAFNLDV